MSFHINLIPGVRVLKVNLVLLLDPHFIGFSLIAYFEKIRPLILSTKYEIYAVFFFLKTCDRLIDQYGGSRR
jgi:hypothetical protein